MSIKDLKVNRIRISGIIGSGSRLGYGTPATGIAGGSPHTVVMSASNASNFTGGFVNTATLDEVGRDVGLFISGTAGQRIRWSAGSSTYGQGGVTLVGGDLHISGNISATGTGLSEGTGSFNEPKVGGFFVTTASVSIAGSGLGFTHSADTGRADTYFFVSGTKSSTGRERDKVPNPAVSVFGGDLVVSGTLYAERQVIEVDEVSTGSFTVSGSLHVSASATVDGGLTVNAKQGTHDLPYNAFKVKTLTGDALTVGDGFPHVVINEPGSLDIDFRVETNTRIGAVAVDAGTDQVMLGTNAVSAAEAQGTGQSLGLDVSVYLSGAVGGKDGTLPKTIVAAGDLVASGGLYVGNTNINQGPIGGDAIFYSTDADARGLYWDASFAEHGALFLGKPDHGVDFVVYGETTGRQLWWDQGTDTLEIDGKIIHRDEDVLFNETHLGIDFRVQSDTKFGALIIDGGTDQVILGSEGTEAADAGGNSTAIGQDVSVYISGTIGGKDGSAPKTIVAASDVVISGSLWGGQGNDFQGFGFYSDGGFDFYLDSDNNVAAAAFRIKDHTGSYVVELDERGEAKFNLQNLADGDFMVYGDTDKGLLFTDAEEEGVAIGWHGQPVGGGGSTPRWSYFNSEDVGPDVKIVLSGTVGGKGGATRNTTLNTGDLVVSGTTYTPTLQALNGDLNIKATDNNADIIFTVDDSGTDFVALTIDGGLYGNAYFTPRNGGSLSINDGDTDGKVLITGNGQFQGWKNSDTPGSDPVFAFYRTRGTDGAETSVQDGDDLGTISWIGYGGSYNQAAQILAEVDGAAASGDMPGRLIFETTADGSSTTSRRMVIKNDGKIGIATTHPSGTLDVQGDGITSQIFILSGSGAKADPDAAAFTDLAFYVSGAIGSKGTSRKGTSAFGGDVVISGSLHGADSLVIGNGLIVTGSAGFSTVEVDGDVIVASGQKIYLEGAVGAGDTEGPYITGNSSTFTLEADNVFAVKYDTCSRFSYGVKEQLEIGSLGFIWNDVGYDDAEFNFRVESDTNQGAILVDTTTDQVLLATNNTAAAGASLGTDVNVFIDGVAGSKDSGTKGTTVFAGDVVISGSLHGGSPLSIGGDLQVGGFVTASMGLSGSLTRLTDGTSAFIAGSGINIVSASNGAVTITGTAVSAEWTDTGDILHPNEGVAENVGIGATGIDVSEYPVLIAKETGTDQFSIKTNSFVTASMGLSGSLTRLTDGTSYLRAGTGINIVSASNGAVTIATSGAGTVTSGSFNVPAPGKFATTASVSLAGGLGFNHAADVGTNDAYLFVSGAVGGKDLAGVSVFGGDLVASGAIYAVGSPDSLFVSEYIRCSRDSNTYIRFNGADTLQFGAGGVKFAQLFESAQDRWQVNPDGADIDFEVFANSLDKHLIKTDAGEKQVLILSGGAAESFNEASGLDVGFYVSGSNGGKNKSGVGDKNISVFGGDLIVSGGFYLSESLTTIKNPTSMLEWNHMGEGSFRIKGNGTQILAYEPFGTPASIAINGDGTNASFLVKTNNKMALASKDEGGGKNTVYINTDNAGEAGIDTSLWISGSIGSMDGIVKGTSTFGGDVVISGSLRAKQLHITTHKFSPGADTKQYLRFDSNGSDTIPGANNHMIAPYNGRLTKIKVRSTSIAGSTVIGLHVGAGTATTVPVGYQGSSRTENMVAADTSYTFNFTEAENWIEDDILGLSMDPTTDPGNVVITAVWEYSNYN